MSPNFAAIPFEVADIIFSDLAPQDLMKLYIAGKVLASPIAHCDVWRKMIRRRWPLCTCEVTHCSIRLYKSFLEMYCKRRSLPQSFISDVDNLHILTKAAKLKKDSFCLDMNQNSHAPQDKVMASQSLSPVELRSLQPLSTLFAQALQVTKSLHEDQDRYPALKLSKEMRGVEADVAWWIQDQSQVVFEFLKTASWPVMQECDRKRREVRMMMSFVAPGCVDSALLDMVHRKSCLAVCSPMKTTISQALFSIAL
ncbi:hypothetical protein CEUSTIGMA_g12816.t1 [Chlamydomonas eustigma]|uniref:F-box domain-containing protein n=1 Tax=Chlamydomonas eustigma TaxID=1157962 RepID=A0A250XRG1_9CHLO|nr:hypothetical protein CEUSTIGMA_g12816.t1 [Chlamydomonas eustigma]|eukprot:GAX85400.1 hypothetical protein CEUSTIGMA_g12816.t1 [Chlamydomonas eustigma]